MTGKPTTLAQAMTLAFADIDAATKDKANPAFKGVKYADLTAVIGAIKPALVAHNLFFTQHPVPNDGGVEIETMLHHASGEKLSLGTLFIPANKRDAHGFGSALTYARRYALVTAFGVPTEDDDGNAAAKSPAQTEKAKKAGIAESDVARIIGLCQAVGGDQAGLICKGYKVNAITELTEAQAAAVVKRLTEKLEAKGGEND